MARKTNVEVSDYERQRQENIAKNRALFQQLQLDAAASGLGSSKKSRPQAQTAGQKRKRPEKKIKDEEIQPRRTSSRIRGIVADSEVAHHKAEEEHKAWQEAERVKRQRVSDDLNLGDVIVHGHWNQSGNWLSRFGPAQPGVRTFDEQDIKNTTDKELKELRERFSNLELWRDIEPGRIKITPERIYSMGFHPTADKPLVFAGDKLGNLGLFDGSQELSQIKEEDDEEEINWSDPVIDTFKIHTRTISAFQFSPHDENALYTASYDSSIRKLDLNKGVAVEIWGPTDRETDEPLSGVEVSRNDPNMLYFTTLEGRFGMHDMRAPPANTGPTGTLQLSEKKIGGFSLHPIHPHIFATASLDRTLKIWDLRKLSGKGDARLPVLVGEHEYKLSVSHAAFNSAGQLATTSYDDTVKIYDFSAASGWDIGHSLEEEQMTPATVVPHNNQTGRWVTM